MNSISILHSNAFSRTMASSKAYILLNTFIVLLLCYVGNGRWVSKQKIQMALKVAGDKGISEMNKTTEPMQ